jgi:hypothetical protein
MTRTRGAEATPLGWFEVKDFRPMGRMRYAPGRTKVKLCCAVLGASLGLARVGCWGQRQKDVDR